MLQVGSDKGKLRIVYSYLGNVHYSLGNYGRAMEYHRQVNIHCLASTYDTAFTLIRRYDLKLLQILSSS